MSGWSEKYPILETYKDEVDVPYFEEKIRTLLDELNERYGYNELNAMLVLKEILYNEYINSKKNQI